MKKALIFGFGGFVGRYLAHELRSHGYFVYGSDMMDMQLDDYAYHRADLLEESQVGTLVADIQPDIIINLAAISSVGQSWKMPQRTMQVNVVGVLNLLEAVRCGSPSSKVMLIGSSEQYAPSDLSINESMPLDTNNPYGISKITQENFAKLYRTRFGMKVYCVRAFNHTGIGQSENFVIPSWCKQVAEISKSGKPGVIRVGNLDVKRDFSDVRDIVRAYRMIIECDSCETIYNVGSGHAVELRELLEYIILLSGQPISIEVDKDLFRPSDTPVICCDHSLISEGLGWTLEFTIWDTLRNLYNDYMD